MFIHQLCDYTPFASYAAGISGLRPSLFHDLPLKDKTSLPYFFYNLYQTNLVNPIGYSSFHAGLE